MTTIQPTGERLRQAVKWISSERLEEKDRPIWELIQKAALRFNLSPREENYLKSFYNR